MAVEVGDRTVPSLNVCVGKLISVLDLEVRIQEVIRS